ncbi:MFS transporter [Mycobacterium marinum]|uniref:MFS transporter n=1 Tax=Mycobacterium marinum TaxID=1781 RepID=UPI000B9650A8|nr:MFS transporter [Mycobacterium marinum]MDC8996621.1 MFS transporter [Mycobacterium marinum]WDZ16321.1 MFS transporter [Mycobacterium marinum]
MTTKGRAIRGGLADAVGGPARMRVIVLLALVVGLEGASNGTIGALAVALKQAFGITNLQVGLLVTASTAIGIVVMLVSGTLADRVNRTRVLWITVLIWSVAMALGGISAGYGWLLASRVALGVVVAVGGPVVASLMGDFFAQHERGRIYGFVLAGEGICTALGVLVSGWLAAITWRLSFLWLAVVGLLLTLALARTVPEPARGGDTFGASAGSDRRDCSNDTLAAAVTAQRVSAHPHLVLQESPEGRSLRWAVGYVLKIRTNVALIVASAFGYFFYTGLGTFAVALLRSRFRISQTLAISLIAIIGVGALIGTLCAGRLADWLIGRGYLGARLGVAGSAFLVAGGFFVPALLTDNVVIAVVAAFLAAIGLGGVNPPLDAARLDIMHSRLWGRAEAIRTTLRSGFTAAAPLVFALVSMQLAPQRRAPGQVATASTGLTQTFLIMLTALFLAGTLILTVARRSYPRDVATALASEEATEGHRRSQQDAKAAVLDLADRPEPLPRLRVAE